MSKKNLVASVALGLALAIFLGTLSARRASAVAVTWNVAGGGDWDTTTPNWTGASTVYTEGDSATFNNTAGGTINLTTNHAPLSTTVSATSGTYTFSGGDITSGGLNKSGGGTLVLNSQITGATFTPSNSGTIRLGASERLQGGLTLNSGTTLDMQGFNETVGFLQGGGNVINMGNLTVNGSADHDGGVMSGTGSFTFNGGSLTLRTNGSPFTYTGGTFVNGGTLFLYSFSNVLPSVGTVTVNAPGVLNLDLHGTQRQQTIGALNGNGNILSHTAATFFRVGNGGGSGTYGGVYSGTGSLTKLGAGAQVFNGNSTYTGTTTIDGGMLVVNGNTSNQGDYIVNNTATLAGTGNIGLAGGNDVTLNSGGTVRGSNTTLIVNGGLALNDGATLEYTLGSSTVAQIDVNGLVTGGTTPGAITLDISGYERDTLYTLVEFTTSLGFDVSDFTVTGVSGDYQLAIIGNALTLFVAVPEPSTCIMLGLGMLGLVCQTRRRQARG